MFYIINLFFVYVNINIDISNYILNYFNIYIQYINFFKLILS